MNHLFQELSHRWHSVHRCMCVYRESSKEHFKNTMYTKAGIDIPQWGTPEIFSIVVSHACQHMNSTVHGM